jgi:2,5-diketo-D-gluconate reductase A
MQNVVLNNGRNMLVPGLSVFQISDPKNCKRAVIDAMDAGCRMIDTARRHDRPQHAGNRRKSFLLAS